MDAPTETEPEGFQPDEAAIRLAAALDPADLVTVRRDDLALVLSALDRLVTTYALDARIRLRAALETP